MDYSFTEEEELFKSSVREFCETKVVPRVAELEEHNCMPKEVIKLLADFELLAMTVSPDYGGAAASAVMAGIAAEELARADPTCSIPVLFLVENAWGYLLDKYGTEEAKKEILPRVTSGEVFQGIATTEADAGSDLAGMRTLIKQEGDGYVVTGGKSYISGVREAATYGGGHLTLAKQTPELGTRGMTLFYLPLNVPGITVTPHQDIGREAISSGSFTIDDVRIPKHYLIGEENRGFYIVHEGYELARGLIALVCVGAASKSLENGIAYIKERKAFGRALGKYEEIQFRLAEHHTRLEAARQLGYKALWMFDREQTEGGFTRFEVSKAIAMAKMVAPVWAFDAINDVMQWQGAFGYTKECPDQKALRGVRSFTLAEGSKEIMKVIVARELLGREFIAYA